MCTQIAMTGTCFATYCHLPKYSFFSGTPVTYYLLSIGHLVINPLYFLLTENIKRGNQEILI